MDVQFSEVNTVTFSDYEIQKRLCEFFRGSGNPFDRDKQHISCHKFPDGWKMYSEDVFLVSISNSLTIEVMARFLYNWFGRLEIRKYEYLEYVDAYSPYLVITWVEADIHDKEVCRGCGIHR